MENDGTITPKRAAPVDDPRRKLRRIAAAVAYGGMEADTAAHRLAQVLAGARTARGRARLEGTFKELLRTSNPIDAVEQAAQAVKWFINLYGAGWVHHLDAPGWVTTDSLAKHFLVSLLLGYNGRHFGLAKNTVGKALGYSNGATGEFIRKAMLYGFIEKIAPRKVERKTETGRHKKDMIWYKHLDKDRIDWLVQGGCGLMQYIAEHMEWMLVWIYPEERDTLADDILTRAHAHIRAHTRVKIFTTV